MAQRVESMFEEILEIADGGVNEYFPKCCPKNTATE
jgi:hypothetical protein